MAQGIDNLEEILTGNRRIAEALKGLEDESLSSQSQVLQESIEPLEELRNKFFMNTVAAIPATRVCLSSSEKVQNALENFENEKGEVSLTALKKAFEELSENVNELLEKAQMRGTTLT